MGLGASKGFPDPPGPILSCSRDGPRRGREAAGQTGYLDNLRWRNHPVGEVTQPRGFHGRPREGAGPPQAETHGSLGGGGGGGWQWPPPNSKAQSPWQKWRLGQTSKSPSCFLRSHCVLGGWRPGWVLDQSPTGLPASLPQPSLGVHDLKRTKTRPRSLWKLELTFA